MLEKQVRLLNGELKALKSVNDMLKKSLINVVGPRSKLMNDIEIATRRILHQHIASAPESAIKNKENLSNVPIPGNFRPIQNPRKLNRPTPPPPPQQAHAELSDLNKVVVANVKVPNSNRPKAIPAQKLPADQKQPPRNTIGQKRNRQTASPEIIVVDLETKVEASSPQPSYQQRLQSLADHQKSTSQNIRTTDTTQPNASKSPQQTTEIPVVTCTDSADNDTEFFIGEDHSPDSHIRQGYTSIHCKTY